MYTYDLQKLQLLLKDFYNLTNIKICIYDSDGNELCFYPEKLSTFCYNLRKNEEMDKRCKECDKRAFAECKKTHKQFVYTCHAGLVECVSPIVYGENIIGYVVIGQIKAKGSAGLPPRITPHTAEVSGAFTEDYASLPTINIDKLNSAIHIMDACTGYEYLKTLMSSLEDRIDIRISSYISDNITGDLGVSALCSVFHLSHSEVYSIFKTYFNTTPAEHVKLCRLNKACELLKKTSMQVAKIACAVGVPDYNYFSKIFKKQYGVSPREYRKNN